jgi:hypothetical protein
MKYRRVCSRILLVSLLACGLGTPTLQARPPYKKALAAWLKLPSASKLNDCRTCHLPEKQADDPAAETDRPHNPFGSRLKALRSELGKAGKSSDIDARLLAAADEDSDGDGVPNLLELLTGHSPGDPADKPSVAEIVEGRKLLAAFLKTATGYPWAPFETVRRPAIPAVRNPGWVRNPIDAFIAAEQEKHGLTPRPEAGKAVLLRRVYLDLIGLPPTREELQAFLADSSPNAYEKVVDRLLASPRHGERWGRHWMDVWRYSDWAGWGQQVRDSQPHIWHWRDWIIEALNADKPYDRMIQEMLAGDELAPDDPATLRATGYLVRNFKLLSREKWMQDTVEHTFLAFQGVTIGCARCHDHMFDPITQKEYYQVRALFEPHQVRTDRLPGVPDIKNNGIPHAYDANLTVPTYFFIRGDDRTPDKSKTIAPGVPEALGGKFGPFGPVKLPRLASSPDRRPFVVQETLAASAETLNQARAGVASARKNSVQAIARAIDGNALHRLALLASADRGLDALALAELDAQLAEARHAQLTARVQAEDLEENGKKDSQEWRQAATEAARHGRQAALLEARRNLLAARQAETLAPAKTRPMLAQKTADAGKALAKAEAELKLPVTAAYPPRKLATYPDSSTGRRLALARWLSSRDNPLTARVAMNHLWLRHFGQALVPSVFDFGRNGRAPSHPALLDFLATEFMGEPAPSGAGGRWSMKAMHRLIVTSSTYRLASTPDEANLARDRDNIYLWRMNSRRLEAELVRDQVFYVAGRLDLTMGGPDLDHSLGLTTPRRSLYFRHAAEKQMEFLKLFDAASVTECYQRKESILPQQALALANSELSLRHARILAHSLAGKMMEDAVFVTASFETVLARPVTAVEVGECVRFLQEQRQRFGAGKGPVTGADPEGRTPAGDPGLRARENLVHVLMNHHDFVTVR